MPEKNAPKPTIPVVPLVPVSKSFLRKYFRTGAFILALMFLGVVVFWDDIQNQWNFFLLKSQKAEVGDAARNFLVSKYQIHFFLRGLHFQDLQVQRQSSFAIHQLWQHPDAVKAVPILLRHLKNPHADTKVRWHSMRALGYLRVPQAVPDLIEVLAQNDILCTNPTCRHYHLWEEAHEALERIFEVKQEFRPEEGAEHRSRILQQWKKYWEKFQRESLQPVVDDKKITTPY